MKESTYSLRTNKRWPIWAVIDVTNRAHFRHMRQLDKTRELFATQTRTFLFLVIAQQVFIQISVWVNLQIITSFDQASRCRL